MIDARDVHINYNTGKEETKIQARKRGVRIDEKTFSCPNGHPYTIYPPDDCHQIASLEEGHAKRNASGTVIPMPCRCQVCGIQFTLYWYRQQAVFF